MNIRFRFAVKIMICHQTFRARISKNTRPEKWYILDENGVTVLNKDKTIIRTEGIKINC